jgi:hypothetical protein
VAAIDDVAIEGRLSFDRATRVAERATPSSWTALVLSANTTSCLESIRIEEAAETTFAPWPAQRNVATLIAVLARLVIGPAAEVRAFRAVGRPAIDSAVLAAPIVVWIALRGQLEADRLTRVVDARLARGTAGTIAADGRTIGIAAHWQATAGAARMADCTAYGWTGRAPPRLTTVIHRTGIAISVAARTISFRWVRTSARLRIAHTGIMALVGCAAHNGIRSDARTVLAGVALRAGVAIVTGGAVFRLGI